MYLKIVSDFHPMTMIVRVGFLDHYTKIYVEGRFNSKIILSRIFYANFEIFKLFFFIANLERRRVEGEGDKRRGRAELTPGRNGE